MIYKEVTKMVNINNKKELSPEQGEKLIKTLKERFEKNMHLHKGIKWGEVQERRR